MTKATTRSMSVQATAREVLPSFGLAFVEDDAGSIWGVTKSTAGPGLSTLQPGARLQLALRRQDGYSLVESYQRLD